MIALAGDRYQAQAARLAAALQARGVKVRVADERQVFHRHPYPRVFDPYLKVYTPGGAGEAARGYEGREGSETSDCSPTAASRRRPPTAPISAKPGASDPTCWRPSRARVSSTTTPLTARRCTSRAARSTWTVRSGPHVVLGRRTELKATPEARRKWSRPWTRLTSYSGAFNLTPQLPEAYTVDQHLILLGDSRTSDLVAALQASDLLTQVADSKYPGPGKALVSYAWSPFGLEKDVILIGASDEAGVRAGADAFAAMADAK